MKLFDKEMFITMRSVVGEELFRAKTPKKLILPNIKNVEELLVSAICKVYNRAQVMQIIDAHESSNWFRAYKVQRKGKILLEGRKGDAWCVVHFSHGMEKTAKAEVMKLIMKEHKDFKSMLRSKYMKTSDDVAFLGELWRKRAVAKSSENFTRYAMREFREKAFRKYLYARSWKAR